MCSLTVQYLIYDLCLRMLSNKTHERHESSVWWWCCVAMGGTSSRGGRAFAAMNDEQALTPTTPRRDVTQSWSLPPESSDHSCSENRMNEDNKTPGSVPDGNVGHCLLPVATSVSPHRSMLHFLYLLFGCFASTTDSVANIYRVTAT